jgi:glycosyltransferase involved in cell wall biosynthesis
MNAFTGGCHFDYGCGRYRESCNACPQLGSTQRADLSQEIWRDKKAILDKFPNDRLRIVSPSKWLLNESLSSHLLGKFETSVIPYGLDTEVFQPRNRDFCRATLGIPLNCSVILFAAASFSSPRKGFNHLIDALWHSKSDLPLFLVSLGGGGDKSFKLPIPGIHIPHVENEGLLSLIYSASDVFVAPSMQDNLPNTILEAAACGIPSVGFNVGGIPEIIRPGDTGFLAQSGDAVGLRASIEMILNNNELRVALSKNCR